jgi:hypothetical protein
METVLPGDGDMDGAPRDKAGCFCGIWVYEFFVNDDHNSSRAVGAVGIWGVINKELFCE